MSAGSGVRAWMLQRLSAVYMALFVIGMSAYMAMYTPGDHPAWREMFAQTWMRLSWAAMFVFMVLHAWVGVRDIIIDYVKSFPVRLGLYSVVIASLAMMLLWSMQVILS